jgi:hypothetical protein
VQTHNAGARHSAPTCVNILNSLKALVSYMTVACVCILGAQDVTVTSRYGGFTTPAVRIPRSLRDLSVD